MINREFRNRRAASEHGRQKNILACVAALTLVAGSSSAQVLAQLTGEQVTLGDQAGGASAFDRYSDQARRALLLARMEASRLGSPTLEPEHLLLGLIQRAESPVTAAVSGLTAVEIRERLTPRDASRQTTSTSGEIPFGEATTRVLQFAAEEAERLRHIHVGPEHFMLGLLREERSIAATMLGERGLRLDATRQHVAESPGFPGLGALIGALVRASEAAPRAQLDQLASLLRIVTIQVENLASDPAVGPASSRLLAGLQLILDAVEAGSRLDREAARRRIAEEPRRRYEAVRPRFVLVASGATTPRARLDHVTTFLRSMMAQVQALVAITSDVGENAEAFRLLEGLRSLGLS